MLIEIFKFKNIIKFLNKIKLITLSLFVLFNVYIFQSCTSKRICEGETNINCYIVVPQKQTEDKQTEVRHTIVDKDGNGLIEIYTIDDLNNIRYNLDGTSWKTTESDQGNTIGCPSNVCIGYELKANLDFNLGGDDDLPTRWSSNYKGADKVADGWVPLGDCGDVYTCNKIFDDDYTKDNRTFTAIFNGNDFEIKNLYIKSNKIYTAGLFGVVTSSKNISNIGITNFWISISSTNTESYSGGLVGYMQGGVITNSYATGSSTSESSSGGLVGYMSGTARISNSYATGSSSSNSYGSYISFSFSGGLVGNMDGGNIYNSYATGWSSSFTSSSSSSSGGLVGVMFSEGNISNSYATGWSYSSSTSTDTDFTYSSSSSGGLVGVIYSGGNITNSYATGWSTSSSFSSSSISSSGGLVGYMKGVGGISNSYATGSTSTSSSSGSSSSGGLVGYITNTMWISNSYATGSTTSTSSSSLTFSGGLVGFRLGNAWVSNSFWNNDKFQTVNNVQRGTSSNPSKLGIGNVTLSNIAYDGVTPLRILQLLLNSDDILGLGTKAFDFTGNSYPKLCVTPLRGGRLTCTSADYLENVLSEIIFLK